MTSTGAAADRPRATTAEVALPTAARSLAAVVVIVVICWGAWALSGSDADSRALSFSLLAGAAFGIVLQRARFCFLCNFRDLLEKRDPRGALSILVALAVGFVLYQVVILAWMPVPAEGRLPPNAHIGPASPVLAVAAFVFGVGMAVSGSCLSAHLYRLGEGSPTAPFALVGAMLGFVLGFFTWNALYLGVISNWTAVWLPHRLGYVGTAVATLLALAVLTTVTLAVSRPPPDEPPAGLSFRAIIGRIFVERWPAVTGGLLVGVIAMAAYLRVEPLGVTAELGSISRTAANLADLLPQTLYGLDGLAGCATAVKDALLSTNGVFVLGLVGGSFAAALVAGQFRPNLPTTGQVVRGLLGGVLMGWGAMTALGCTIGVLLSGIHAGALAGWVFLFACTAGVWLGLIAMRRLRRR
jgi:uncharacterized membrane protein YedE/YeeE